MSDIKYDVRYWNKRLEDTKRHLEESHSCSDEDLEHKIKDIEINIEIAEAYKQGRADERAEILNIINKGNCEKYKVSKNPKWCKNVRCEACMLMQIKEQNNE